MNPIPVYYHATQSSILHASMLYFRSDEPSFVSPAKLTAAREPSLLISPDANLSTIDRHRTPATAGHSYAIKAEYC